MARPTHRHGHGITVSLFVWIGIVITGPLPLAHAAPNGWTLLVDGSVPYSSPLFPDVSTSYSILAWTAESGRDDLAVKITGVFPHSRYTAYDLYELEDGNPIGHLKDVEIEPDAGSVNPFRPFVSRDTADASRTYTVWFAPGTAAQHDPMWDNATVFGKNVLFRPPGAQTPVIAYRIYKPDPGCNILGCVDQPHIEFFRENGNGGLTPEPEPPRLRVLETVRTFVKSALNRRLGAGARALVNRERIDFYRTLSQGLTPTDDNGYLVAGLSRNPADRIAVIRFKAPTFPDTSPGGEAEHAFPADHAKEVRYWSFSIGGPPLGRVSSGISDAEAIVDEEGFVTVVIAPDNALLRSWVENAGFNFLPTGRHFQRIAILRHLCADSSFAFAAKHVPEVSSDDLIAGRVNLEDYVATKFIGDYAPTGHYYTIPEFFRAFGPRLFRRTQ